MLRQSEPEISNLSHNSFLELSLKILQKSISPVVGFGALSHEIIYYNDAWLKSYTESTGSKPQSLIRKNIHKIYGPESEEYLLALTKKAINALELNDTFTMHWNDTNFRDSLWKGRSYTMVFQKIEHDHAEPIIVYSASETTEIDLKQQQIDAALKTAKIYLTSGLSCFVLQNERFEIIFASEAFRNLIGLDENQEFSISENFYKNIPPTEFFRLREKLSKLETGEPTVEKTYVKVRHSNGTLLTLRRSFRWFPNRHGEGRILMVQFEDMTELEARRLESEMIINKNAAVVFTRSRDYSILSCSDAWTLKFGFSRDETIGRDLVDFMIPEDAERGRCAREMENDAPEYQYPMLFRFVTKSGDIRTVELHCSEENFDNYWLSVVSLIDVTDLSLANARLKYLSEHDSLTDLLSRRGMEMILNDGKRKSDYGLFFIDVDRFKSINDSFGHTAGDAFLKALSDLLKDLTLDNGLAVRLGGDEFALFRTWAGWKDARKFASKIRSLVSKLTIVFDGHRINGTVSIGLSLLNRDGPFDEAMRLADLAMIEAKDTGPDQVRAADEIFVSRKAKIGALISTQAVRTALLSDEIAYDVQPIINSSDQSIIGFEALIRWNKSDDQVLLPSLFERQLNEILLEREASQIYQNLAKNVLIDMKDFPDQYFSFNFSIADLAKKGSAKKLLEQRDFIADHDKRKFVFEISEKYYSGNILNHVLQNEISLLRKNEVLLALDDFGVESNNISRLQDLQVDIIKLDKKLIKNIENNKFNQVVVEGIVITLKSLNLAVVAEGVETLEQAKILIDLGVTLHQGFFYSKPMPPKNFNFIMPI